MSSVTTGRPVSLLRLGEQPQALLAEALEGVRARARLVGAAAEHRGAGRGDDVGRLSVWSRDSTVHGPAMSAKCSPPTLRPPIVEDGALAVLELGGGELVRLEDRDDAVDAGGALELEARDVLEVADRPDDRHLLPAARVRPGAHGFDPVDDGRHVLRAGRRLHHDHHVCTCLSGSAWREYEGGPATALGPEAVGRRPRVRAAERLAKSPGGGVGVGAAGQRGGGREGASAVGAWGHAGAGCCQTGAGVPRLGRGGRPVAVQAGGVGAG